MSREPKLFQVATAKVALDALSRKDGPRRFLVADEVGLGKTVVARSVIDQMSGKKKRPLVVFYVTSNTTIAHQNQKRLLEFLNPEEREDSCAKIDRLTLAANPAKRPKAPRVQLYTLTPATSIPLAKGRGGLGKVDERALIYHLIVRHFPSLASGREERILRAVLQGKAGNDGWNRALVRQDEIESVSGVRRAFFSAIKADGELGVQEVNSANLFKLFADAHESKKLGKMLGRLRNALAVAALHDIHPDLVIFDEFQKFREVLISPLEAEPDAVTKRLRGEVRSDRPAVLLLSATPYRHYSSRRDEKGGSSHHTEFFELIKFLFGTDETEPKQIEDELTRFREQMLLPQPDVAELEQLKRSLECRLLPVMSRTERKHAAKGSPNACSRTISEAIQPEDIRIFKHWAERLRSGDDGSTEGGRKTEASSFATPYWFSVPYPVQMLGKNYAAWRRAQRGHKPGEPCLSEGDRNKLRTPEAWPHPQLRATARIRPAKHLARPWISPSLPWWGLAGIWEASVDESNGVSANQRDDGKLLVFSRFKAVPPAVASLLSFGVEGHFAGRPGAKGYARAGESNPLQLKANSPGLLALFFPSPCLIRHTDPRQAIGLGLSGVRRKMNTQVRELVSSLGVRVKRSKKKRPICVLLPALEGIYSRSSEASLVVPFAEVRNRLLKAVGDAEGQRLIMRSLLQDWEYYWGRGLTEITEAEIAVLAEHALSGPGVVLGRAWYRFHPACLIGEPFGELLDLSWSGMRSYLSRSAFRAALSRRGENYADAIRRAVAEGNLESVLDEHLWITSRLSSEGVAGFAKELKLSLSLVNGRHRVFNSGAKDGDEFTLRCHAAMPFGDAKSGDDETDQTLRSDLLRCAFNTPFWPHVLVTTSLGQEGLDFHVWCRHLLHWDLPGSPLDMEQREGRIQRYGGLSVRYSLARKLRDSVLENISGSKSPWEVLAKQAEEAEQGDDSGLSPWWGCDGEALERQIVGIHQSRHVLRFNRLSHQRLFYRLALGQPHQQDFIENVSKLPPDGREKYALNLSAWVQNSER